MSFIDRLIGRLGKVFSRDPQIKPVIAITRNKVYTLVAATDGNSYQLNIFSDADGNFYPVFQRFPGDPAEPTQIASDNSFYYLEIFDNGDGTFTHDFILLSGDGVFGPATFAAIDGYRYQLGIVDNGDGTFFDTYTRVLGGDAGGLAPTTLSVRDLVLTIQADGQIVTDLSTGTLTDLAAVISGTTGFNAVLVDPAFGDFWARGLYEVAGQDIALDQNLYYPTALLYNEMQTYSWALMDQAARLKSAERQLYMNTAEDEWLDYWGNEFFKIPRYSEEADVAYAQRIANQIIQASQNNVALELIIKQTLGVDVSVVDAAAVLDQLTTEDQANAAGRFILENLGVDNDWLTDHQSAIVLQVEDLVNRYRAAGTGILLHLLTMLINQVEMIATEETMQATILLGFDDALAAGPIRAGAGWRAGTPGLKAGNNDAIKEQIFIQKISTADGSVAAEYLYGG